MKITIPESINDIALHQFQKYDLLLKRTDLTDEQFNVRKIEIFTGLERQRIPLLSQKDYSEILILIDKALEQTTEFQPTFKIKDVEFGFIPNFDKITAGEYRDLTLYSQDVAEMHKLMAVLFRPIKKKRKWYQWFYKRNNYKIVEYNGTEKRAEVMKYMPLSIVNGALVFFSNLANELIEYTQKYTTEEQARANTPATTLKNGGGMRQFLKCVKAKFGSWIKF
ncbi:MAG: hypothetical protein RL308_1300 [Bacteroidota bacterium]|jgi:hypothetical protein